MNVSSTLPSINTPNSSPLLQELDANEKIITSTKLLASQILKGPFDSIEKDLNLINKDTSIKPLGLTFSFNTLIGKATIKLLEFISCNTESAHSILFPKMSFYKNARILLLDKKISILNKTKLEKENQNYKEAEKALKIQTEIFELIRDTLKSRISGIDQVGSTVSFASILLMPNPYYVVPTSIIEAFTNIPHTLTNIILSFNLVESAYSAYDLFSYKPYFLTGRINYLAKAATTLKITPSQKAEAISQPAVVTAT